LGDAQDGADAWADRNLKDGQDYKLVELPYRTIPSRN